MNEDEFRDRLRDALGEPPPLRSPDLHAAPSRAPRTYAGAMAVLAAVLAVVLIVVLMSTRVLLRPLGGVVPAAPVASAPPAATPLASSAFPCALPAIVTVEAGDSISQVAGFINMPDGGFRVDPNATVADLPQVQGFGPAVYSATLHRWLPANRNSLSPDGARYVYVEAAGKSSNLHIVDAAHRSDRVLWTYGADISVDAWDGRGIIVMTVPFAGGVAILWLVDPTSGAASQIPASADPTRIPFGVLPGAGSFSPLGSDGNGQTVVRLGSRDQGTRYSVVLVALDKVTATLYSGVNGDGKDFDPDTAWFDAHGIWLGNFDSSRFWLWNPGSLRSFAVHGLPAPAVGAGGQTFVSVGPAGPCIPGSFAGVAASPVAAAPSPSTAPAVDWSPLFARPVTLPAVTPGSSCPVSDLQHIAIKVKMPKPFTGDAAGWGQWPAYVGGQDRWYSDGSQGLFVLTAPDCTVPCHVPGRLS